MANCKLTKSLDGKNCEYSVAGLALLFLANWFPAGSGSTSSPGEINYTTDSDGVISAIHLPTDEKFYKIGGAENSLSYADTLLANGNGGKYRQHTVNGVILNNDIDTLKEGDALSLGKFIAVAVGKDGVIKLLGRTGGLTAPAGGFDYNSGAAEGDASGWTMIQQGSSMEIAPIVANLAAITPIDEPVITP